MENAKVAKIIDGLNAIIQELGNELFLKDLTIENLQKKLAEAEAAKETRAEALRYE